MEKNKKGFMKNFLQKINAKNTYLFLLYSFLFLLPWHSVYIIKERFLNSYKWQYGSLVFYFSEVVFWFLVIAFIFFNLQRLKSKKIKFWQNRFSRDRIFVVSIFIFILYLFLNSLWSIDGSVAWQNSQQILESIILFLIILISAQDKKIMKNILYVFFLGSLIPAVLGICQFLLQSTWSSVFLGLGSHPSFQAGASIVGTNTGRWLRAYGTFEHPNSFAVYLFFVLAIFYFYKQYFSKIFFYLVPIIIMAMFFTFSRAGFVALLILFLFAFLELLFKKNQQKNKNYLFLFNLGLVFVLTIIFLPIWQSRLLINSQNEVQSISERLSANAEAVEIIKDNFIFGVGPGNYTLASYNLNSTRSGWEYQPVHNIYLLFISELGVVGLGLFVLSIYTFLQFCGFWQNKLICSKIIVFLFFYLILGLFDHFLFSSYYGVILGGVYFALLFSVLPLYPPKVHN